MSAVWLLLWLAGHVHLLALNGLGNAPGRLLLVLLPVLALLLGPALHRRLPGLAAPGFRRGAGLAGLAGALAFARLVYLAGWDVGHLAASLATTLGGLGSLLALGAPADEPPPGPGHWLWTGAWMLTGFLDPALPLLGGALAAALAAFGAFPPAPSAEAPCGAAGFPAFLLLGLALPKPWWDFGPRPDWAWAGLALGLGGALAAWGPLRRRLALLPARTPALGLGLLAVLYGPAFLGAWGLALGGLAALAWDRAPRPFPRARLGLALLLGLLLSFVLHANLWIPGLRHLIWLGN